MTKVIHKDSDSTVVAYVDGALGGGARELVVAFFLDFNVGIAHGIIRIVGGSGSSGGGGGGGGGGGNSFLILFGHLVAKHRLFRRTVGVEFFLRHVPESSRKQHVVFFCLDMVGCVRKHAFLPVYGGICVCSAA